MCACTVLWSASIGTETLGSRPCEGPGLSSAFPQSSPRSSPKLKSGNLGVVPVILYIKLCIYYIYIYTHYYIIYHIYIYSVY